MDHCESGLLVGDESRLVESLKECMEEQEAAGDASNASNNSDVFEDGSIKEENLNTILANENLLGICAV
jgi:hypothetical protein